MDELREGKLVEMNKHEHDYLLNEYCQNIVNPCRSPLETFFNIIVIMDLLQIVLVMKRTGKVTFVILTTIVKLPSAC